MPVHDTAPILDPRIAGPALDEQVDRAVFGLTDLVKHIPPYSTDPAVAWQIVDVLGDVALTCRDGLWTCNFGRTIHTEDVADSMPLVVCRAALSYVEYRQGKSDPGSPRPMWVRYAEQGLNRSKIAATFWSKVQRGAPDACWPWMGSRDAAGYGVVSHKGKQLRASRIAYALAHGEGLIGFLAGHRCDNPPCVNPAHLFKTTPRGNVLDAIAKGRHRGSIKLRSDAKDTSCTAP